MRNFDWNIGFEFCSYLKFPKVVRIKKHVPKLTYKALHSIDKQNVELPIAIFHDTTIV